MAICRVRPRILLIFDPLQLTTFLLSTSVRIPFDAVERVNDFTIYSLSLRCSNTDYMAAATFHLILKDS
jgi:hypothetical protein